MCVFVRVYQGKTHTLIGNSADPGLMPRAVRELFAGLKAGVGEGREYLVRVSYVELYNEEIRDLLSTGPGGERLSVGDHPDMGAWSPPRVSPLPSPPSLLWRLLSAWLVVGVWLQVEAPFPSSLLRWAMLPVAQAAQPCAVCCVRVVRVLWGGGGLTTSMPCPVVGGDFDVWHGRSSCLCVTRWLRQGPTCGVLGSAWPWTVTLSCPSCP
jgi:hypothetical protein